MALFSKKNLDVSSNASTGFTLIELLVVLSIMGLIAGAVIANFAGTRPARNLRIAQNELVTNLRKVQSYALSSRNLPNGLAAQYYILKIDAANNPQNYYIQGIFNVQTSPQLMTVETINLPQEIKISNPIAITTAGNTVNASCLLIAFRMPFAKLLSSSACNGSPPNVNSGDSYDSLIKYVVNTGGTVNSDSIATITLTNLANTISNQIIVNGITGTITFK